MAWGPDELPVTRITKKVEEFRKKWVLVDVGGWNAFCDIPDAPPVKDDGWSSVPLTHQTMIALVGGLKLLRDAGLTGQMVARDFVQRRIAPLQAHAKPMWMYLGPQDRMRLHPESLTEKEMASAMKLLFGPTEIPGADEELLMPLHQLPLQDRLQFLESMPTFTARGLEGEDSADAAPVVEDDDNVAKYLADSEADEDAEATAASASAGEASSSRSVHAEAVVEVSSGEEEFVVTPSRRITEGEEEKEKEEEEEQVQGTGAERREGRSKKKHDKPAGCPAGTPLKRKAEVAPSGASSGGIASRLRRSVQWVDIAAPKTR